MTCKCAGGDSAGHKGLGVCCGTGPVSAGGVGAIYRGKRELFGVGEMLVSLTYTGMDYKKPNNCVIVRL